MQESNAIKFETNIVSTAGKRKGNSALRKAPQAPKRFKSSYILFFIHEQVNIQTELGGKASVRTLFIIL